MEFADLIIQTLVYPGLMFTIGFIIFTQWLYRKLSARLQFRRGTIHAGPAGFLQPLADLLKLVSKKDLVNKYSMKLSPVVAVSIATGLVIVAQLALPVAYKPISAPFDFIVVLYFLLIVPLAIAYLSLSHPNPYATIGAARYLALLAVSEPLYAVSLLVPLMLSSRFLGSEYSLLRAAESSHYLWTLPASKTAAMLVASIINFTAMLAVVMAKPFDSPEAESEIYWGVFTELGGPRLALGFFLKFAERVVYPLIYSALFLGATYPFQPGFTIPGAVILYLKTTVVFTIITILDNTLPRYKPEQAVEFILKYLYPPAVVSIILAAL